MLNVLNQCRAELMIITSFSADYFEQQKEDPGVAKHNGQYMGKFIQSLLQGHGRFPRPCVCVCVCVFQWCKHGQRCIK